MTNLAANLTATAARVPDKVGIKLDQIELSWSALHRAAAAVADSDASNWPSAGPIGPHTSRRVPVSAAALPASSAKSGHTLSLIHIPSPRDS